MNKELSTCCNGPILEDNFFHQGADEYNRRWGTNVPAFKDLTLCTFCHNECEYIVELDSTTETEEKS